MNTKTIGLIALVVVALGLLAVSLKRSFFGGPAPASQEQGQAMKAAMERAIAQQKAGGGGANSGGAGAPQGPGGMPMRPSGTGNAPGR